MSFAAPIAFALAALAVPILVLYILKVRMRRVPVSTNLFWRQIYDEKPPRSIWQNLRHIMSLLAQLAFLALLVLAIADPYLPWQLLQARRLVLVVDNSASMQATDVAPNRLASAKTYALDLVAGLRERDEVAIVVAGDSPEVVVGMTGHVPTLRRAIEAIEPTDKSTHLASAIRLGKKLIGSHPHGQVLVLTDGCVDAAEIAAVDAANAANNIVSNAANIATAASTESDMASDTTAPQAAASQDSVQAGPDQPEPAPTTQSTTSTSSAADLSKANNEAAVVYKLFGEPANNVGITQFQVRRSLTDPLGYEILASVLNASTAPVKCRLEVTLDDVPVDVVPLTLDPGELWKRAFEKTSIDGGTLVGRLTRFESIAQAEQEIAPEVDSSGLSAKPASADQLNQLQVDDTAWALLPARAMQKVLLVSPGNLFLRKVFESNALVELTVVDTLPENPPTDSLIVLHRNVPTELPQGNLFVLDPVADSSLWKIAGEIADPIITQQADDSPLMTHIRLDSVVVPSAAKLQFAVPAQVLAGTVDDSPIYASLRRDGGKCLVLLVDLEESDLAFRTAFPIMVTNAINWFSNQSGQLQPSVSTGSLVDVELADQDLATAIASTPAASTPATSTASAGATTPASRIELQPPVGDPLPLVLSEGATSYNVGPLDRAGIWELSQLETANDNAAGKAAGEPPRKTLRQIAVNVASERESNLQPDEELLAVDGAQVWGGRWFTRPIWFYLTLLAGLFAAAEWFLYHRRFIS